MSQTTIREINFYVKEGTVRSNATKEGPVKVKPGDTLRFKLANQHTKDEEKNPQIGSFRVTVDRPQQFRPGTAKKIKIWTAQDCGSEGGSGCDQSRYNATLEMRLAKRFYFRDKHWDVVELTYVFQDPNGKEIPIEPGGLVDHTWIHVEDC